jgi:aromatic ring-opening dioxygenase catalytic subunit (LigB family)
MSRQPVLFIAHAAPTYALGQSLTSKQAVLVEQVYAKEFTAWVREAVVARKHERLHHALELAPYAKRVHSPLERSFRLLLAADA